MANKVGEGVPNSYKESAKKGGDILWHVKIKGQTELAEGIPLHMSLKVFSNKEEMDIEDLKKKVKQFKLKTPEPKELEFKTKIFTSERDGKKYYMLIVKGTDKAYEDFYDSLRHCGTTYKNFMMHVTIDKGLYDRINEEGLKPEEVEFNDLTIEYGAGNTVHEFAKSMAYNENKSGDTSMQITANEISSVEEVGTLSGHPVKMVRTKGGFWIAIARKKGKHSEEAVAAGSHPAIVKFNLEKQFPEYQPHMMKSEGHIEPVVAKHSHFLSDAQQAAGYDIFSIQEGPSVEFKITKHASECENVKATVDKEDILIQELNISKEFAKAMASATVEKALSCKMGLKLKK